MALSRFGFLVTGAGLDPTVHRLTMTSASFEMRVVGVAHPALALAVARGLVDDGVQLLELCGGFGPVWTARVLEAIEHRVPVGAVGYGPEALAGLHAIFEERVVTSPR